MYNPAGTGARRRWIEIYNPSMYSWNLHNWKIQTAGHEFRTDFTFPDVVIQPSQYIIVGEANVGFANFNVTAFNLPNTTNVTLGIRLICNEERYTDTLLYDFPNINNLPDDVRNPANDFVLPAPRGYSLARRPNGHDTNRITDWEVARFPTPSAPNFIYYDLSISDLFITIYENVHTLHTVIHDLSTAIVDNSLLVLRVFHNGKTLFKTMPNIIFDNDIAVFELDVSILKNTMNIFIAEISYPQDVDNSNNTKRLAFWEGFTPLVINELQYQPVAPEPEWIELFNRSHETIVIENAHILNAAGRRTPFSAIIEPHDYLIITRDRHLFESIHPFVDMNKVIQPNSWAILNNTRDTIQLFFDEDVKIDSVSYVGVAAQRGRSLERVDPWSDENIQWLHSSAEVGSTPLSKNSRTPADIDAKITDVEVSVRDDALAHRINIMRTGLMSGFEANLLLFYRHEGMAQYEYLNELSLWIETDLEEYFITPFPSERGYHHFLYRLQFGKENHVLLRSFLNGSPPVVVNEIMFNPNTSEPEWIELFKIRNQMPAAGLKLFVGRDSIHVPYFDAEFALITASVSNVTFMRERYNIPESIPIFRGIRSLRNAGDTLTLKDYDDNLYERFEYRPSFSPLRGVSAERISPILPPEDQNWTASLSGSTPGKRNSVHMDVVPSAASLHVENNPFSPHRGEHCIIKLSVKEQRVRADLKIFDIKGREIVVLANKMIIPGEYAFIWNGRDRNGRNVNPGVYPAFVNVERLNGERVFQSRKLIYIGH